MLALSSSVILTISMLSACTVNTGGVSHEPFVPPGPPATEAARGICEALRPEFPIPFHGGRLAKGREYGEADPAADRADTVLRIKRVNARYDAICS